MAKGCVLQKQSSSIILENYTHVIDAIPLIKPHPAAAVVGPGCCSLLIQIDLSLYPTTSKATLLPASFHATFQASFVLFLTAFLCLAFHACQVVID